MNPDQKFFEFIKQWARDRGCTFEPQACDGRESMIDGMAIDDVWGWLLPEGVTEKDDAHFEARVTIAISPQFFGWVMALGRGIRIAGPAPVVKRMREEAARLAQQYEA